MNNVIISPVVTFLKQADEAHAVGFYGWREMGYILRSFLPL